MDDEPPHAMEVVVEESPLKENRKFEVGDLVTVGEDMSTPGYYRPAGVARVTKVWEEAVVVVVVVWCTP